MVEGGVAIVKVDNLVAGDHTVAVEYSGDGNYSEKYAVGNFTVKADKVDSEITVVDQGNGTVVIIVGDNATGNVTLTVDGENITVPVVDGVAVVDLGNVTPGTHDVEVIYSGDDTHKPATTETTVTAPKYETPVEIEIGEATEGEPVTITVKVPENATGNVTVYVDGKEYPAEIKDGVAVVTVDNLTAGDKTIAVEYSGDDNYAKEYAIGNFTVKESKADSDIIVVDQGNGTVVVVVGDNATGNVTVTVDGQNYTVPVVDGVAVVDLGNVTPGTHDVEVKYSGDDTHKPATAHASITAPKLETPITVDVENSKVGETNTITVNVPNGATGNITLAIDGKTYTSEIKDGKAVFTFDNLTAGDKTIAVDYIGDDNYVANHTIANVTVSKHESFVDATITDIDVGENVTVTVTVPNDATGQVLIDIDGVGYYVNVTDGTGVAQIPRMPNGVYNVTLTYTGDDKYESSSTTAQFTVEKLPSFVKPYAQDILVGENEVIRFVVPEDATGTLTVIIGGEEFNFNLADGTLGSSQDANKFSVAVSEGKGILVLSGLPKGEYTVSVKYNGDAKYLSSTNETVFKVIKNDTSVQDEGNGTITIDIPDNATGYITVIVGNNTYYAEIVNGTATVDLVNETPGKHNVTVIYSGDEYHDNQTVHIVVDIPKHETPISVDAGDMHVGETAVITVNVPEKATGNVTIEINGKKYTQSVEDGKAVFYIDGLTVGDKTVAVKYDGDDYYVENSTTSQFTVYKCESTISATSKDINVGTDEVITVTVPSDATGQVLVDINGVGYYGTIINGKAKVIIPELPSGEYTAKVTYYGDDKYLLSTTSTSFTVTKVNTPMSAYGSSIEVGEDATIVVNLPEDATGTVTIVVDGKTYTAEVKDGKAVFVIPGLEKGDHQITASYSGDKKYAATETIADIEVYYPEDKKNETSSNNNVSSSTNGDDIKDVGGINLADYPTGNPIWILLLVVLAIGSTRIRRFKK
ncbi:Ig-like domain-containing protein, partial [Methanobrevibacter sp.]|uniref:Ig-like domain-containing protein n=1 Tax=Methanobrevibacter sp. TaxID=66852 RepID=UPI0038906BB1